VIGEEEKEQEIMAVLGDITKVEVEVKEAKKFNVYN
jgi:hypothetical protein